MATQQATAEELVKKVQQREWSSSSWRELPIMQQPNYEDKELLGSVLKKISHLPPIVHYVSRLRFFLIFSFHLLTLGFSLKWSS
jgi:hypothetical protein